MRGKPLVASSNLVTFEELYPNIQTPTVMLLIGETMLLYLYNIREVSSEVRKEVMAAFVLEPNASCGRTHNRRRS